MEIHKALPHSPSQPPMRTEVKPYSFQPPNLPQWIGKTPEGGSGIYHGPEKWAVFLELDGTIAIIRHGCQEKKFSYPEKICKK